MSNDEDTAPLHTAAMDGKVEAVKTLVKCGYGINSLHDGGLFYSFLCRNCIHSSLRIAICCSAVQSNVAIYKTILLMNILSYLQNSQQRHCIMLQRLAKQMW